MGWFPTVHPLRWPGDEEPPAGKRSRTDWLVMAALSTDLVLFAIHVAPGLWRDATSPLRFILLVSLLLLIWLGPFLGLLRRRGRGVALLSYGIAKLAIVLATLGWWWAHGVGGNGGSERPPLTPLVPSIAWHGFGVALAFIALTRHPMSAAEPADRKPSASTPGFLSNLRKI